MSKVKVDALSDLIAEYMSNYSQDITKNIKKSVDTVSNEVNQQVKDSISFKQHTGDYVKSFRIKKAYEDGYKKVNVWYVTNGQYRLTHLLENGHALRLGGRTKAYPHIKYGEELARKRMEELAKGAIEDAGS